MTDYEYKEVANLNTVRHAVTLLRDYRTPEDALENRDLTTAMEALLRLEERMYDRIEKLFNPPVV